MIFNSLLTCISQLCFFLLYSLYFTLLGVFPDSLLITSAFCKSARNCQVFCLPQNLKLICMYTYLISCRKGNLERMEGTFSSTIRTASISCWTSIHRILTDMKDCHQLDSREKMFTGIKNLMTFLRFAPEQR